MQVQDLVGFVTPSNFCIAIYLKDHISGVKSGGMLAREPSPTDRKDICILALRLINGPDLPFAELVEAFLLLKSSSHQNYPRLLVEEWINTLTMIIKSSGVDGLLKVFDAIEKIDAEFSKTLRRTSMVGIFFRKMLLGFRKLSFSEVDCLFKNLVAYTGENPELLGLITQGTFPEPLSQEEKEIRTLKINGISRDQAEQYITNQVELLSTEEISADSPDLMSEKISIILRNDPSFSEAHFLSYLNCVRMNEYSLALKHLHEALKNENVSKNLGNKLELSDTTWGYRYSSLSIAALHARFGQTDLAELSLREAILLSQVTEDHVCLQYVLSWLYRLKPSNKKLSIERCILKSREYQLGYLESLGLQSLAKSLSENGGTPSDVMTLLRQSDVVNYVTMLADLEAATSALKSSIWTLYGRADMACVASQLVLMIESKNRMLFYRGMSRRKTDSYLDEVFESIDFFRITEETMISLCTVARYLNDRGYWKQADKVTELAEYFCPSEDSVLAKPVYRTIYQIKFERHCFKTEWQEAKMCINRYVAFTDEQVEQLLMRWQLSMLKGEADKASLICQKVKSSFDSYTPVVKARVCIMEAESACLVKDFTNGILPLMTALTICMEHRLSYLHALVKLHVANIQLQLGLSNRALRLVEQCLPAILGHGSLYDRSRVKVLLAKCHVALASKDNSPESGMAFETAIRYLIEALSGFETINAHGRAKDVLYLIALLYNTLDEISERNVYAARFKKKTTDFPINVTCNLANVL